MTVLTTSYDQKIFALAFHLVGGDKKAANHIVVSCIVKANLPANVFDKKNLLFINLVSKTIKECQEFAGIPLVDDSDLAKFTEQKRSLLKITKKALYAMPFMAKAHILLRDQLHLSYKMIAVALKISESNAKRNTLDAKIQLRQKIDEILRDSL